MQKAGRISVFWCLMSGLVITGQIQADKHEEAVNKFIKKAEEDSKYIVDNYRHQELEITEDLKDGIVTKKEQKTYLVEKRYGSLFKKLISYNGIEVTSSDFQAKRELISVGLKLLSRYDFTFNRIESGNKPLEKRFFVFSFRPKTNLSEGGMEERVLSHLAGEAYIDPKTMVFKGLTAHLISNVKYALPGFLGGKLNKLDCIIKTEVIDGRFAVNFIRVEYQYSIRMFGWSRNGHSIKTIFYQNYERRLQ